MESIDSGGFSDVYRAVDEEKNEEVAIKVLMTDDIEHRQSQSNGVSEGEGGDDFEKLPETGNRERKRGDEEEMVVTGQDMDYSMAHIIAHIIARRPP